MDIDVAVRRTIESTGRLIEMLGPRPSGSEQSRQAADELLEEARDFADRAWSEDFAVHTGAFLGWIRLLVTIYVAAVALLWLGIFWLAALLTSLGLIVMIGQFFFYREVIDGLFPKKSGRNVLAALEPQGEVLGQLIISGHHDSAFVFNFLVHQPSLYPVRVIGGIASFVMLLASSWVLAIWQLVTGASPGWSLVVAGLFTVLLILVGQLWWFASSKATPGAGDNLASSVAAWETLRLLSNGRSNGRGLRNLRVVAASWDAEEAGLRGARSWVRHNGDGRLDIPTWNLNLECLYDAKDLFILTSDINGSVQLSQSLAERCQRLLSKTGLEIPAKPIAFLTGATDAAELAKGGAEAISLIGMPWGNDDRGAVYHTPADVIGAVDEGALAVAIRLALDLATDIDGELSRSGAH